MKYTWLLFDADDTLFDFSKAESNALKWTLEQSGLPYQPDYIQKYSQYNQQVWREFERGEVTQHDLRWKRFHLFFESIGHQGDMHAIGRLYTHNLAKGIDLLEDAEEVIRSCKKQYQLALVTNGLKDVQVPRLAGSRLSDCFDKVFISEEIGAAKPTRAYFDAVFSGLNQPARKSVLIIGDSLTSDIQGGIEYGIDTCWYNPGQKPSELPITYQITRLKDLLTLL